jgi:xanthine dehydrogenase YagS FAD-binding subunit
MNRFEYVRADTIADAVRAPATPGARALAGGTNLVDLMKYDVAKPSLVVDINRLPLKQIEQVSDGGLTIGALVTNSALAWEPRIAKFYPLLGTAAAVGNAVFHATGKRVREFPITIDKLLAN